MSGRAAGAVVISVGVGLVVAGALETVPIAHTGMRLFLAALGSIIAVMGLALVGAKDGTR